MDYTLLLGVLMPPIIDLCNARIKSDTGRFLMGMAVSLLAGGAVAYLKGDLTSGNQYNTVSTITIIFTESEVIFNLYWKNSFLRSKLVTQGGTPPLEQREGSPVPLG